MRNSRNRHAGGEQVGVLQGVELSVKLGCIHVMWIAVTEGAVAQTRCMIYPDLSFEHRHSRGASGRESSGTIPKSLV